MDYESALKDAFLNIDGDLISFKYSAEAGSTSCVILITPDKIYCANAGDSRAVLNCAG